jgi:hypothetical protein
MSNESNSNYSKRLPMSDALDFKIALNGINDDKTRTGVQRILNLLAQWGYFCG